MSVALRIKNYEKHGELEYQEVDARNPLPVTISGGVIGGGSSGDIPVFDGRVNVESLGGVPVDGGRLQVELSAEQAAALASPDTQAISGTVQIGNQVVNVMLMNDKLAVEGTVTVGNANLDVTIKNAVLPVSDNGGSLTVDGTVTVGNENLPVTVTNPLSVEVEPGNEPLKVEQINVPASVAVSNFPASVTSVSVNNQPAVYPVTDNGGSITVDGTVTALPSGTQAVSGTVAATQSGTWTFTPSGTQAVSGTVTTNAPTLTTASTALTVFRSPTVANAPVAVKTSAGRVHKYHFGNPNSAPVFVHLYNATTANVTVGTTTPLATYMVAANAALDGFWPNSDNFSTAISVAVTTTVNGATSPTAGALVNLGYV